MNIYEMMTIVNGVTDKVCYVNEKSELEYHPELRDFYLWLYCASTLEDTPDFANGENDIDEVAAFDYLFNNKGIDNICSKLSFELINTIETAIDSKVEFILDEYRASKNVSLSDVALSSLINLIYEKANKSERFIDTVGEGNIKAFIDKFSASGENMTAENVVKAMVKNKVI